MQNHNKIKLFEKQKRIYSKRAWGRYRKIKWVIMIVTLGIYYLAPWIRWDRGPNVPDQAILIDILHSRAYFFLIEIWPQEIYYIAALLIFAAVTLFLITSLFGRVWCGFFCPQTVWTDLFIWVERIFQGDRNARMKLDKSPFSFNKFWRKFATHITWLLISLATSGAWVFYFNDAPTLMENILNFDISFGVASWIVSLTLSTYLMAGYAREQVCTYMCPYARFQSAMFDKDSLIISYDKQRGEPRGKYKSGDSWDGRGHCVNCTACVQVCPMGIDIRDGLQMECIACGMCIDACNGIMRKLSLPEGLVRYDTIRNQQYRKQGKQESVRVLRSRTIYYSLILLVIGSLMLYNLLTRSLLELHVIHDRNPLFVKLSDNSIRNGYEIKILNKSHYDKNYSLTVSGIDNAMIRIQGAGNIESNNLPVYANSTGSYRVFVTAVDMISNRNQIKFLLKENDGSLSDEYISVFISEDN